MKPTKDEAIEIFKKYNKSESLLKHALTVGGVMGHFAKINGEDAEKWTAIGVLHDIDYEMYPDEHCKKAVEILKNENVDDEYIHAVVSHGYGICSDVEPTEKMEKILFTIDELSGLINAACLMRPSKSVLDIELKSVKKKYKDKSFAAGVDRSIIEKGCEMNGESLDYFITETIMGMRECAEEIGLKGNL